MSIKKIRNIILSIIVSVVCYFFVNQFDLFNKRSISGQLFKISQSLNERTPIRLDQFTMLTTSYAENNTLTYRYIIEKINFNEIDKSEIDKFRDFLFSQIKNDGCTNDQIKQLLKKGAIFQYLYSTEENKYLFMITLKESDCSGVKPIDTTK